MSCLRPLPRPAHIYMYIDVKVFCQEELQNELPQGLIRGCGRSPAFVVSVKRCFIPGLLRRAPLAGTPLTGPVRPQAQGSLSSDELRVHLSVPSENVVINNTHSYSSRYQRIHTFPDERENEREGEGEYQEPSALLRPRDHRDSTGGLTRTRTGTKLLPRLVSVETFSYI